MGSGRVWFIAERLDARHPGRGPGNTRNWRRHTAPRRYSRNAEEWIIRDFLKDRRNGVFLDVGANHYRDENNTYYLESQLGWTGIAVEPLTEFEADYKRHRPGTRFRAFLPRTPPISGRACSTTGRTRS